MRRSLRCLTEASKGNVDLTVAEDRDDLGDGFDAQEPAEAMMWLWASRNPNAGSAKFGAHAFNGVRTAVLSDDREECARRGRLARLIARGLQGAQNQLLG